MSRTLMCAGLIAIASSVSLPLFAQTSAPATREAPNPADAVIALAGRYANAIVERDVATLDRLLAEDFVDVSPDGTVSTRARFIDEYANPSATAPTFESAAFDAGDARVRIHGDTALMTGRSTWRGTAGGHAFTGMLVSTMVALRREGQWRIASSHSSAVPPAPGASSPAE